MEGTLDEVPNSGRGNLQSPPPLERQGIKRRDGLPTHNKTNPEAFLSTITAEMEREKVLREPRSVPVYNNCRDEEGEGTEGKEVQ